MNTTTSTATTGTGSGEPMSPVLVAAYARLHRASSAAKAAQTELVDATIATLTKQVPASFPDAAAVILEWSDQGDWLHINSLAAATGDPVEYDAWTDQAEELEDLAINLDGYNASDWAPYMVTLNYDGTARTRENMLPGAELYRLELAAAIARLTSEATR